MGSPKKLSPVWCLGFWGPHSRTVAYMDSLGMKQPDPSDTGLEGLVASGLPGGGGGCYCRNLELQGKISAAE